jgi:hypothetical protein
MAHAMSWQVSCQAQQMRLLAETARAQGDAAKLVQSMDQEHIVEGRSSTRADDPFQSAMELTDKKEPIHAAGK